MDSHLLSLHPRFITATFSLCLTKRKHICFQWYHLLPVTAFGCHVTFDMTSLDPTLKKVVSHFWILVRSTPSTLSDPGQVRR